MKVNFASPYYLFPTGKTEKKKNSFEYLSEKQALKEIISDLCKRLHHPVALIDYRALMSKKTSEKIESMVEMFPMRRACSILRKCAGDDYCTYCDRFHAKCMDVNKVSIENRIKRNIHNAPDFFYPEYKDKPPIVLEGFNRPVMEYHCPMLGYRELLFPLMYEGRIHGVFFAGQIMVYDQGDQETNRDISKSFFKNKSPEYLFKGYVDAFNAREDCKNKFSYEDIKTMIVESDENARQYDDILSFKYTDNEDQEYYSKTFNSKKEYIAFIDAVCHAIADTEKTIAKQYENRRRDSFFNVLEKIGIDYYAEYGKVHSQIFKNKHEARTEELNCAWDALKVFTNEIMNQFKLIDRIILFGDRQGIKIGDSNKKRIVFSFSPEGEEEEKTHKGTVDYSIYNNEGISDCINSIKKPEILNSLSDELPKENSIIIQCQDIAILIQVKELNEHLGLYTALADAIGTELIGINSIIALCSANLTKEKYLLTLRMYRHENAHISTRLMGNINRYFENNGRRFLSVDEDKRQMICNDMKNTVQLISNIADNISFVTGSEVSSSDPLRDVEEFDVVDMLNKWRIMFRDELEIRNLEIKVCKGADSLTIGKKAEKIFIIRAPEITRQNEGGGTAPREIVINARLFELLVYNLVDNAVKYAYEGTNIYLIWNERNNNYELSVTSYGPRMPNDDSMYGLYVRGSDERFIQGDGLGLYVVKRIAKKLGLKVCHTSERISYYNAPLIEWYNNTDFSEIEDYSKIEEHTLTQNNNVKQVLLAINDNPSTEINETNLTIDYLLNRIQMETWRTTFFVKIPIKFKRGTYNTRY